MAKSMRNRNPYLPNKATGILAVVFLLSIWLFNSMQSASDALEEEAVQRVLATTPQGGDFTLQGVQGDVSLSDFAGKMVYLYFGYIYCPDICPTNLAQLQFFYRDLNPSQQDRLQVIFVSVDSGRDTPKNTDAYAKYFHPDFIGLTASRAVIDETVAKYGAVYQLVPGKSDDTYSIDHSAFTYVIDRQGKLITQLPHAAEVATMRHTFDVLSQL